MNVKAYNQSGKEAGTVDLPDSVFGLKWNADLVHQVVMSQRANQRQVVAHTKGRGEVRGGGRKPWRQKGTGRARHGSIRSPIWKGGGVTHGPSKERNFKKKINKKMAARAFATVLSAKLRDSEALILDAVSLSQPKTKEAAVVMKKLSGISGFSGVSKKSALLLLPAHDKNLIRSFRNLPHIDTEEARNVIALDLLNHKYVIMPKGAVEILEKRFGKKNPRLSA